MSISERTARAVSNFTPKECQKIYDLLPGGNLPEDDSMYLFYKIFRIALKARAEEPVFVGGD